MARTSPLRTVFFGIWSFPTGRHREKNKFIEAIVLRNKFRILKMRLNWKLPNFCNEHKCFSEPIFSIHFTLVRLKRRHVEMDEKQPKGRSRKHVRKNRGSERKNECSSETTSCWANGVVRSMKRRQQLNISITWVRKTAFSHVEVCFHWTCFFQEFRLIVARKKEQILIWVVKTWKVSKRAASVQQIFRFHPNASSYFTQLVNFCVKHMFLCSRGLLATCWHHFTWRCDWFVACTTCLTPDSPGLPYFCTVFCRCFDRVVNRTEKRRNANSHKLNGVFAFSVLLLSDFLTSGYSADALEKKIAIRFDSLNNRWDLLGFCIIYL